MLVATYSPCTSFRAQTGNFLIIIPRREREKGRREREGRREKRGKKEQRGRKVRGEGMGEGENAKCEQIPRVQRTASKNGLHFPLFID